MLTTLRLVRLLALATVVGVLAATLAGPAQAAKPTRTTTSTTPPPRTFGVAIPGAPTDLSGLSQLTSELGAAPQQVTWYAAWSAGTDFPSAAAANIAATGATPEVTWEPWDPSAGVDQPAYSLDRITAGAYDSYLTRWATQIRSYGQPVVIRLAHEMNGNWYPWSEQVNGNGAGDYAAMWRHVVSLFRTDKATNVIWTWSPNVPYTGATALKSVYPGDSYVDRVALDGYNWSTLQTWSSWQSFADIFATGVSALHSLTTKPIYIGEVGCPEVGGDKAAWVTDMFAWLSQHPEVRGVTWFDYNKETDWRIDSSAASLAAFRAGLPTFV